MSDMETVHASDDEIDVQAHKNLLAAVGRLNKTQFIKKASRTEPNLKKSEFHLVKSKLSANVAAKKESAVVLPDLVNILSRSKKHSPIGKELKEIQRKKSILAKPLERPVVEQIRRTIGYERTKKNLNRWTAVVTQNQAAETLSFPLVKVGKDLKIIDAKPKAVDKSRIKTDLMVAMEKLDAASKPDQPELNAAASAANFSREELIARNRELRLLRMRESQRSAKARIQNKIKSKKFHKILKKEKVKNQMKEFETLQKSDPELALQKLDQFEKNRVVERALLRHKNTGTWAKNLQVRAKYDTSVRKELAEQLALSRELTQKQRDVADDQSDADDEPNNHHTVKDDGVGLSTNNPWLMASNVPTDRCDADNGDIVSGGYRKYWNERNTAGVAMKKYKKELKAVTAVGESRNVKTKKSRKTKPAIINGWLVEDNVSVTVASQIADNIDDLFDNAEEMLQQKIQKKLKRLRDIAEESAAVVATEKSTNKRKPPTKSSHNDLSFKKDAKRPQIDDELKYGDSDDDPDDFMKTIENARKISKSDEAKDNGGDNINPDQFITVKRQHLHTALPDMDGGGDSDEDEDGRERTKRLTIAEAFENDDILADFQKEKDDERTKNGPQEIDLTLPGWGSWAGCGISHRKKTNKLILKFPTEAKRRDENKGNVIIVDESNRKLREHQVSDLPFPFTSVKNFEASIRAPIGRDFVPAMAHQLLTRPTVSTKMGAIIEPISEEMLVKEAPRRIRKPYGKPII